MSSSPATGDHAARRLRRMADENSRLRRYVAEVMDRLRENERLFSRLSGIEAAVLAAPDPEALCFALLRGLCHGFDLDMARLWFERPGLMGDCKMEGISGRDLVWIERGDTAKAGLDRRSAWLMRLTPEKGFDWLTARDHHLGSMALLVLGDLSRPFGVLGMGSVDAGRFEPGQSADFLQHLARVASLSLEHAITKTRAQVLNGAPLVSSSDPCAIQDLTPRLLRANSHHLLSKWFGGHADVACLYMGVEADGEAAGEALDGIGKLARKFARVTDPLLGMEQGECALLLPGCSARKAARIAERLIRACKKAGADLSVGLACASPEQDMRVKSLIAAAEQAMYVARALGGNRLESSGSGLSFSANQTHEQKAPNPA